MNIHEEIVNWANEYIPQFNALSEQFRTHYYTQSPLDSINDTIDLMIIGINPKGNLNNGARKMSAEDFLRGNPTWKERFNDDGTINKEWKKYIQGARYFMGYDDRCHNDSIDNDKKTVWTNLSPFESHNGSRDLRKELMEYGIKSTLDLIRILRPKRIVLLGIKGFQTMEKVLGSDNGIIEFSPVFYNVKAQVGRIHNIPTVCLTHPSGHWDISNTFNSMFVFLHQLSENTNSDQIRPLKEVVDTMRKEIKMWIERVSIE